MKKTLTVNLNNIVFHIDDDAYEMLQTYLAEIAEHFQSEDEKKEIMTDIEARIAELFTEKLQRNKNVVNVSDVQEIIEIMGKPSQYAGDDEETDAPKTEKKQQKTRRFYRDPENAVLGGIAGGIAAYFSWDVTWVRIAFVILALISAGYMIPIYIIVWIIAPQAITASQRLEMQGEDVTVESIKTEMNNVKNYVSSDKFKQSASTAGDKILDVLRGFFKVIFGLLGAVLGIVGIVVVGVLIMSLFFLIFEPSVLNTFAPDLITNWAVITPDKMVMLVISLILVVGCPIFLLVYWAIRIISGKNNQNHTASWVVLILWFAGLFMFYSIGANTFIKFNHINGHPLTLNWSDDNSPYTTENRNCEKFNGIDISGNIELVLTPDSVQKVSINCPEDYLSKIQTNVDNGILHIYSTEIYVNKRIKVYISTDSIKSLSAKGACEIKTESEFTTDNLELYVVGASETKLKFNVTDLLKVEVQGASKARLEGKCTNLKANVIGASEISASDLISKNADVYASGASHADVYATESLKARANGASNIKCQGSPKSVDKSDSGASSIDVK